MTPIQLAFFQGFTVMLGLITALGPQNLLLIRESVRGRRAVPLAAFCITADSLLIALGVALGGAFLPSSEAGGTVPVFLVICYLGYLGINGMLRSLSRAALAVDTGREGENVLLAAAAVTLLNPHVYLDTVGLIGGVAASFGSTRWAVAAGAIAASAVWFSSIVAIGRTSSSFFSRPAVWRTVEAGASAGMLLAAWKLFPR